MSLSSFKLISAFLVFLFIYWAVYRFLFLISILHGEQECYYKPRQQMIVEVEQYKYEMLCVTLRRCSHVILLWEAGGWSW